MPRDFPGRGPLGEAQLIACPNLAKTAAVQKFPACERSTLAGRSTLSWAASPEMPQDWEEVEV